MGSNPTADSSCRQIQRNMRKLVELRLCAKHWIMARMCAGGRAAHTRADLESVVSDAIKRFTQTCVSAPTPYPPTHQPPLPPLERDGAIARNRHCSMTPAKGDSHIAGHGRTLRSVCCTAACYEHFLGVCVVCACGWRAALPFSCDSAVSVPRVRSPAQADTSYDSCGVRAHALADWRLKPTP